MIDGTELENFLRESVKRGYKIKDSMTAFKEKMPDEGDWVYVTDEDVSKVRFMRYDKNGRDIDFENSDLYWSNFIFVKRS